jgi:hypothetical protein
LKWRGKFAEGVISQLRMNMQLQVEPLFHFFAYGKFYIQPCPRRTTLTPINVEWLQSADNLA